MKRSAAPRLVAGVRWNADESQWEMRCDSCKRRKVEGSYYWPIDHDYWWPQRSLSRCRACWAEYDRQRAKRVNRSDPEYMKKYREENRVANNIKARLRFQKLMASGDAERLERYRAKRREATRRYRARLKAA